ncbi:uncharacterized, partial [Tachysurus ichikawai]
MIRVGSLRYRLKIRDKEKAVSYALSSQMDGEVLEFQQAALYCLPPGSPLPLLQLLIQDTSLDTWLSKSQPYIHVNNLAEIK